MLPTHILSWPRQGKRSSSLLDDRLKHFCCFGCRSPSNRWQACSTVCLFCSEGSENNMLQCLRSLFLPVSEVHCGKIQKCEIYSQRYKLSWQSFQPLISVSTIQSEQLPMIFCTVLWRELRNFRILSDIFPLFWAFSSQKKRDSWKGALLWVQESTIWFIFVRY